MDRVLARCFLGRTSGGVANWKLVAATAVPLLNNICLQGKRADYAVKFKKQATSIAKRMTFRIPTPQGSGLGETIGAGRRYPVVLASFRSPWTGWTGRSYAAEARLRRRIRR